MERRSARRPVGGPPGRRNVGSWSEVPLVVHRDSVKAIFSACHKAQLALCVPELPIAAGLKLAVWRRRAAVRRCACAKPGVSGSAIQGPTQPICEWSHPRRNPSCSLGTASSFRGVTRSFDEHCLCQSEHADCVAPRYRGKVVEKLVERVARLQILN